ncbi:Formate hydrogenlyase transcriptional activator [hydrothermal vent metagenome]|uniref:Formate hydrogenlyase transcriptional activator n=1 Tax=hydrothermal vent metagenome TaxID=652676 RepID=A0A3B1C0D6_9ZZZZ
MDDPQKNSPFEHYQDALDEHLRFEKLLGLLSAKLVNLPLESIDTEIKESMKLLVDFFEADRCHIGRFEKKTNKIIVTHYYAKEDVATPQISSIGTNSFSFIHNQVVNGERVIFSNPNELPAEAKNDKDELIKMGIKSLFVLPLKIENEVKFALSLSTINKELQWKEHTVQHIKIISDIITNVLSRKIILEENTEKELWSQSILQGMPQIAYVFDSEGKLKRWNENLEKILGYSPEELNNKFVLDFIVEEFKEETMNRFMKVLQDNKEQMVQYELLTKSGETHPYQGSGSLAVINGEKYLIGMAIDISDFKNSQSLVEKQLEEIRELKNQIEAENYYLKEELKKSHSFDEIIGKHETLLHSLYRIEQVAPTDTTVLLEGETGTGKELFARAIHQRSKRKDRPLVVVNCASIPPNLVESELFGHEKGAFTGAVSKQIGKFELTDGATLFLDEVGELPYNIQSKLLRVLQEGTFERVGGKKTIKVDVRIIAATNRILEEEVKKNNFRADLYYRLNVYPVTIAPLRERKSDIPLLVEHFVNKFNNKFGKNVKSVTKKTIQQLQRYSWTGNVRELENIIERAMILSGSSKLNIEKLPSIVNIKNEEETLPLEEYERRYIISVLEKTYWRVDGPNGAAKILDIHPETLRSRMRKLQIKRPN